MSVGYAARVHAQFMLERQAEMLRGLGLSPELDIQRMLEPAAASA